MYRYYYIVFVFLSFLFIIPGTHPKVPPLKSIPVESMRNLTIPFKEKEDTLLMQHAVKKGRKPVHNSDGKKTKKRYKRKGKV